MKPLTGVPALLDRWAALVASGAKKDGKRASEEGNNDGEDSDDDSDADAEAEAGTGPSVDRTPFKRDHRWMHAFALQEHRKLKKKEAAWEAKQPRAQQAKSKSRVAAFEELRDANNFEQFKKYMNDVNFAEGFQ